VRVAIVSDTHMPRGARALPDACVQRLRGADAILHCGDFVTARVLHDLEQLGPPLHAVFGNVDTPDLQARLPERRVVELGGARIGMVHVPGPATKRAERLHELFGPDVDAVVFGHTHMPEHAELEGGFQAFNPGSPTERRRAPAKTMGMATVAGGRVTFELVVVG
jgi:putative phosphoesterase